MAFENQAFITLPPPNARPSLPINPIFIHTERDYTAAEVLDRPLSEI